MSVLDGCDPVLDAVEEAISAGSMTVTSPSELGVRLKVKVVPLPDTALTVALVAEMSESENPFTSSENVAVTGMVVELVFAELVVVKVTVGPPLAADEMLATPPSTATAERSPIAVAEKKLIYFDFIGNY